ncbi:hypothetical protein K461DRAFT_282314, partial [Myriangium duriaei CBS 260.36]
MYDLEDVGRLVATGASVRNLAINLATLTENTGPALNGTFVKLFEHFRAVKVLKIILGHVDQDPPLEPGDYEAEIGWRVEVAGLCPGGSFKWNPEKRTFEHEVPNEFVSVPNPLQNKVSSSGFRDDGPQKEDMTLLDLIHRILQELAAGLIKYNLNQLTVYPDYTLDLPNRFQEQTLYPC